MTTITCEDKTIFLDDRGFEHKVNLSDKIADGGQGQVFKSKNNKILVKEIFTDKKGIANIIVDRIRSLNLENLNFALPLTTLVQKEGYTMRLMDDMDPISKIMKNSFKDSKDFYKYYFQETGGIQRRLKILSNISFNLYNLHSRGLVYADISENNIFISSNLDSDEAWFIDCDNIDYFYNINSAVGTRGFASPEIMQVFLQKNTQKQISTIENDIYAFANLFVNLVFVCDPFRGSILENMKNTTSDWDSDEEDWDSDDDTELTLDDKIDLGMISWIGEGDIENKPIYGLSSQIDKIISSEIRELLNKTLGYEGRKNPKSRPSMRLWYEEINNLLNSLKVFECGHILYKENVSCLVCKEKREKKALKIQVDYNNNKRPKHILRTPMEENFVLKLTYADLSIGLFNESTDSVIEFEGKKDKFLIKNKFTSQIKVTYDDEIDGEQEFLLKTNKKQQVSKFENLLIEIPEIDLTIKIK